MSKLKELTVRYTRKQQTQPYCSVDFEMVAVVTPKPGETSEAAAFRAFEYCRNHVMLQMSAVFPSIKEKLLPGVGFDLEAAEPLQTIASLPESVQQALVEAGIDPDRFIYHMLPENVEAAFTHKGD